MGVVWYERRLMSAMADPLNLTPAGGSQLAPALQCIVERNQTAVLGDWRMGWNPVKAAQFDPFAAAIVHRLEVQQLTTPAIH
jgi:hypothetical protein